MKFLNRVLLLFVCMLFWLGAAAQAPVNDSCHNAQLINISAGGFGLDTFYTDSISIDSATVQVGEYFHSSLITSGNDKKSIWFKFYIGARRGVDIELKQNANAIATKDCGFTTYYADQCLPGSSQATAAKLTTLNQFGSSFHPCMDPGWYMVQVSAKARAMGKIYLRIIATYPYEYPAVVNAEYDAQDSAYDFGNTVVGNKGSQLKYIDFELGCYTVLDSTELYLDLGTNYLAYNQSAWFVFQSAYDHDNTQMKWNPTANCDRNDTMAFRLYRGDVRNGGSLTLIDSFYSDWTSANTCYYNCSQIVKNYKCLFDSGQYYSVQLLFHEDNEKTIRYYLVDQTSAYDSGYNQPISGKVRDVGIVRGNKTYYYGFSCGSYIQDNTCGSTNDSIVEIEYYKYNLAQWVQITLDQQSRLTFKVDYGPNNNYKRYNQLAFRLFKDTATSNCADVDTTGLLVQGFGNGWFTKDCMEPGTYLFQLLGTDSVRDYSNWRCYETLHLGGDYRIDIQQSELPATNRFALANVGAADSINSLNDLPRYTSITGGLDTVSCHDGVRPLEVCDTTYHKTMYRVFTVRDSDGDGNADSGMVYVYNLQNVYRGYPYYDYNAQHRLYKGNALTLRNSQSVYAFPDTLLGLNPQGDCMPKSSSSMSMCLTPGDYTLVSYFDSIGISRTEQPTFRLYQARQKFGTYAKAEFIDSITGYGTYYGAIDTFSCSTNPDTIDGVSCGRRNGYHVFYLDSTAVTSIDIGYYVYYYGGKRFSLFKGDIRNGKSGLQLYQDGLDWSCTGYNRTTSDCRPLEAGWYTVVVSHEADVEYDSVKSVANGDLTNIYNYPYRVTVTTRAPNIEPPKYYRPSKAAFVDSLINSNQPLSFDTNYSSNPAMFQRMAKFNFPKEVLECDLDTPLNHFPKNQLCDTTITDITYYVFNLEKNAFVRLWGGISGGTSHDVKLYKFDVRKDSALLATATPIQDCNYNANYLEFCNLQAGTYSVVYFTKRTAGTRVTISPIAHIDTVLDSRFDFAFNAYDFGAIRGDSTFYDGKIGDVHPQDTSLPASHDIITCRTGASVTDPTNSLCYSYFNPYVYYGDTSVSAYKYDSSYTRYNGSNYSIYNYNIRRNLWYTFTIGGAGKVTVQLNSLNEKYLTAKQNGLRFSLYESDENGNLSFANLKSAGKVDSTTADGLTYKEKDYIYCYYGSDHVLDIEYSACDSIKRRRYYVLVEAANYYNNGATPNVNQHVWLEVKYDTNPNYIDDVKYDYYSNAGEISSVSSTDLLTNGDASNGMNAWTDERGDIRTTSGGRTNSRFWMYSYYSGNNDTAEMSQTVDLSAYASEIAAGNATLNLSYYFQTNNETPSDIGRYVLKYYNASGSLVSTSYGSWDSSVNWRNTTFSQTVPTAARSVNLSFEARRFTNRYFDYFIDDISLNITTSSKITNPDPMASGSVYKGDPTYFKGATLDTTDYSRTYYWSGCSDPNVAGTVWYKFDVDSTGYMYYNYRYTDYSNYGNEVRTSYDPNVIRVYKSTIPGDSVNGLQYEPRISYSNAKSVQMLGYSNYICVAPGTYYVQINKCNWGDCNDFVYPQILLDYHRGDFCETAVPLQIDTLEKVSDRVLVNCHTIGTDFGEDGSNMGCLYGPADYKSTWFVIEYTDTTKIDLEFQLGEYTDAKASEIRYRTYYGNCKSLTPGPCNNNALTTFVLDCLRKGTYYVQIVTPEDATGDVELSVEAKENTDTTCNPVDIFQPNAAFYYNTACPENVVEFINTSSRGDSIRYFWDFGYNGLTDTITNPIVSYPALNEEKTYTVKLVVEMVSRQSKDSIEINVVVPYSPYANIFNTDTMLCAGDSVLLTAEISNYKGVWNTKDTADSIMVTKTGWYYYDMLDKPQLLDNPSFYSHPTSRSWIAGSGSWTRTSSYNPRDSNYTVYASHTSGASTGILELYQDVDVSYDSADIDSGIAKTSLTSYIRGHASYEDEGQIILQYLDKNGNLLAIYQSGLTNYGDNWQYLEHSRTTPPQTRKLRVILQTNKVNTSTTTSYAFFDFLKLKMRSACSYKDSVYVQFNPIPELSLPDDTTFCVGDSVLIGPTINYQNPYVVQDSMRSTVLGNLYNNASHTGLDEFVELTTNINYYENGQIEYVDSSLLQSDSFEISFEYFSSGMGGYALYFYLFASTTPNQEDFSSGGYSVALDKQNSNQIQIEWNNARLNTTYSGINLDNGKWRTVRIVYKAGYFEIYIDGVLHTTYTDPNNRTQVGYKFGLGARSLNYNEYRVRNFHISRNNPEYVVITPKSERTYNYAWSNAVTDSSQWFNQSGTHYVRVTDKFGCVSNYDTITVTETRQYDSLFTQDENVCSELDTFRLTKPVTTGWYYGHTAVDSSGLVTTDSAIFGNNTIYFGVIDTFGCLTLDTGVFILDSVPQIQIDSIAAVCKNDTVTQLTVNNNDGFFYGGNYVDSSGLFYPDSVVGSSAKVYYRTAGNYCIGMDSVTIFVDTIPDASISQAGPFCLDAGIQTIQAAVNTGGRFTSATFIDSTGNFNPSIATVGQHTIYYRFTDGNGCSATDSSVVHVDSLPNAAITAAGPFCENAGVQQLSAAVNSGGLFTPTSYLDTTGSFNPALAQAGNHQVFYTFTDGNNCSSTDSTTIVVDSLPSTVFTTGQPYCENSPTDTLMALVNSGGKFYGGTYVDSIGVFNPVVAGKGSHKVLYTFTDGKGCMSIDSQMIQVDTLTPVSLSSGSPYCIDDTVQTVTASPNLGGYFTATSYIDSAGNFSPSTAGYGNQTIYFTQTNGLNCSTFDSITVFVDSLPDARIQTVSNLCANDDSIQVNPKTSGGYFYGGSFIDSLGYFNPVVSGPGNHTVYYSITNTNGCRNTDSITIGVDTVPNPTIIQAGPFCENGGMQVITTQVTGGVFTATSYVDTSGNFNPATAQTGSHLVVYTITDGNGCSDLDSSYVRVDSIPSAAITPAGPFCANDTLQQLNPAVNTGGLFTATSYLDTLGWFNPFTAGAGDHRVYYSFTDGNGCSNTDSTSIHIDTIPSAAITPAGPFCENAGSKTLTALVNSGGRFTSTTYLDTTGRFDPALAQRGTHRVYYSFTDGNGCSNTDSTNIRVDSIPDASITPAGPFCYNAGVQTLTAQINTGGRFGPLPYIDTIGRFNPVVADTGTHKIYYSFTDGNSCSNTDSTLVKVDSLPNASIVDPGAYCLNGGADTLQPEVTGGYFSGGSYVDSSGRFDPWVAGVGDHKVFYTITSLAGCTNIDSILLHVDSIPSAAITPAGPFCENGGVQTITAAINPGGRFTPTAYLDTSGRFDPTISLAGSHKIFYSFTDGNGCSNTDSTVISIDTIPSAEIANAGPFCLNSGVKRLAARFNSGGTFGPLPYMDSTGNFDPLIADTGRHKIYYEFTDGNGCYSKDSNYVVVDSIPDASIVDPGAYCLHDGVDTIQPAYSGGFFSGGSFIDSSGRFNPLNAGVGLHRIYYTLDDGAGCINTDSLEITVDSMPDASIVPAGPFCENGGVQILVPQINSGGRFVPNTFIDTMGSFDPSIATAGNHRVYYVFTDGRGCTSMDSVVIQVDSIPDASIIPAGPFCENGGMQLISPQTNTGGRFTPTAYLDTTGNFDPAIATPGTYRVFYSFTDGNGCSNTDSFDVQVDTIPSAAITPAGPFCENGGVQVLVPSINSGGRFTPAAYLGTAGNFDPAIATPGTYRVFYSFTDGNGCSNTDSTTISIDTIPSAAITPSGPFCANAGVQNIAPLLNTAGRFTQTAYLDTTGAFDPAIAQPGMHRIYYSFTDGNNCSNTDSLDILVDTIPDASILVAGPFCENDGVQRLSPAINSGGSFSGAHTSAGGDFDPLSATAGVHRVYYSYTDNTGCSNTDSTDIVVNDLPDAGIIAPSPFCSNASIATIRTNTPGGTFTGGTYISSIGEFDPGQASIGLNKVVYTLTNSFSCTAADSAEVEVWDIPTNTLTIQPAEGCEILEVNLATEPQDSIHWTIGADTYINQTSVTDSFTAGTYNVRLAVSNANRCQIVLDSFILVHPTPTANFSYSPDEIFISNPEVFFNDLSSGNVIGWDWDFGDNNFSADENPIHTYGSGGEYNVILFVETDEGCIDSTSQKVIIKDALRVFIPNAISIQDDGLNETFRVVGIGYTNIKIQIFNRWGERIYQSDNFTQWDGTYRGEKVQMGAYVYIMTITDNRGMKHHMDGEIQVIR